MNLIVDTYACEWKGVLEDREKKKRFRPFVNVDASDSSIVFVKERGQIRPAKPQERPQLIAVSK